jgi:molecular chaperone GrpE
MSIDERERSENLLPPADLTAEIDRLQDEVRIERDRNLRTLADFANYRRRMEMDGKKIADEGKRAVILPLLDIVDDLEKALRWTGKNDNSVAEGLRMIHQKFLALLEAHGVVQVDSIGQVFDHALHEAVAMEKREGCRPGTIVDELRRGYSWNDELLRPAQVRVAG